MRGNYLIVGKLIYLIQADATIYIYIMGDDRPQKDLADSLYICEEQDAEGIRNLLQLKSSG
jgi:hypothetical protein